MGIHVRSWNGSTWDVVDDLGPNADTSPSALPQIQLDVDGQGRTLMAWSGTVGTGSQIYVYRLNK